MSKFLITLAACAATGAMAQHHSHSPTAPTPTSSYAGEEAREIKALSPQEQRAWLDGQGMGLARPAELNGFPGPMHVLELAAQLELTTQQQETTRRLMERHKAEARSLGAELVAAERRLDEAFRTRQVTPAQVDLLTQRIGELQSRIRASHLKTHLEQTALLRPAQVAAYDRLRGYAR